MIYTVTLTPAVDRSLLIPGFAAGKVNRVLETRDDPGGKGINVSKVIAALGGRSVAMGIVGGSTGVYIRQKLKDMGIETDFASANQPTRINIKISDPESGATTDINEKGVIDPAAAREVLGKLLARCAPGDICVIAGKLSQSVDIAFWIREIKKTGALVYLDTEGDALKQGAQSSPDLIKPNDSELQALCDCKLDGEMELLNACTELARENNIDTVCLSMGDKGALLVSGSTAYKADAVKIEAVCTVGAGDAMMAALAYGKSRHMSTEESFALSIAASAAAVTCMGTQAPDREKIYELLKAVKLRRIQ